MSWRLAGRLLALALACSLALPPGLARAQTAPPEARRVDVLETMTNYSPTLRGLKIVRDAVSQGRADGKLVDGGVLKSQLFAAPYLTHLGVNMVGKLTDLALLLTLTGSPVAIVASRVLGTFAEETTSGLGYELSLQVAAGTRGPWRDSVGRALENIDATNLMARMVGSAVGALIGQAVCPLIGTAVGGLLGAAAAGFLANALVGTYIGKWVADGVQRLWTTAARAATGRGGEAAPSAGATDVATGTPAAPADLTSLRRTVAQLDHEVERLAATRADPGLLQRAVTALTAAQRSLDAALAGALAAPAR